MSRPILCLVFVAILASISQGRVIEKRSPGGASDLGGQIDKAVDLKAIGGHIDTAAAAAAAAATAAAVEARRVGNKVVDGANDVGEAIGDFFEGLGRKKRSPAVADFADQIDNAIDLRDIGNHIDTAIDSVGDFGSDAIDEINDIANSDAVRRVENRVVDVANDVGDAFVGHLFG